MTCGHRPHLLCSCCLSTSIVGQRFFSCPLLSKKFLAAALLVTVEKPKPFLRRLFQAPRGNHQEKDAEGLLRRFPAGAAVSNSAAARVGFASFNRAVHFQLGLVCGVANLVIALLLSVPRNRSKEHLMQHARFRVWQPAWGPTFLLFAVLLWPPLYSDALSFFSRAPSGTVPNST